MGSRLNVSWWIKKTHTDSSNEILMYKCVWQFFRLEYIRSAFVDHTIVCVCARAVTQCVSHRDIARMRHKSDVAFATTRIECGLVVTAERCSHCCLALSRGVDMTSRLSEYEAAFSE
jgi:hypothetical protein